MTMIDFEELGTDYKHKFYDRALYLIERGYLEGDYREVAKKMYEALMKKEFEKAKEINGEDSSSH